MESEEARKQAVQKAQKAALDLRAQRKKEEAEREKRVIANEFTDSSEEEEDMSELNAKLQAAKDKRDAALKAARDAAALAAVLSAAAAKDSESESSESGSESVKPPCTEKNTFAKSRMMPWFSANECCGETRRGKDGQMYKSVKPRGQKSCVWKKISTSDDEESEGSAREAAPKNKRSAAAAPPKAAAAAAPPAAAAAISNRPRRAAPVNYKGMGGGFSFDHLLSSDESS